MAEYIDRSKLSVRTINVGTPMFPRNIGVVYAEDIAAAPVSDVAPVVHGRWIKDKSGVIYCSECEEEHAWLDFRATYCDSCGAKMDGEESNE